MTRPVRIGIIGCGSVSNQYMKVADQLRWRGTQKYFLERIKTTGLKG